MTLRTHRRMNYKSPARDNCQTPFYALQVLAPYLPVSQFPFKPIIVWESACGEGLLVKHLEYCGYKVTATDLPDDYFNLGHFDYDIQITNPPYTRKFDWITKAYLEAKPFALLMPSDMIFTAQAKQIFKKYPLSMLVPDKRIDYKMPNKGWDSSANFHTSWFTFGLGLPPGITYCSIDKFQIDTPRSNLSESRK